MWVSGLYQSCASPYCESTALVVVRETFDAEAGIYVGEQRCTACECRMLFSRKPSSPMEIQMAKKKPGKPRNKKSKPNGAVEHTPTQVTYPSNGGPVETSSIPVPAPEPTIGEAMRIAVEELGELVIDNDLAPAQMLQAGQMAEEITRAKAAYVNKAEAAKIAKKTWEGAQEALERFITECSHPKPLPLFDEAEREADEANMLAEQDADGDQPSDESAAAFV